MSARTEHAALVTLLRSGKRPWQIYASEVEEAGSAVAVLDAEGALHRGQTSLLGPHDDGLLADAATDIAAWEARGLTLLTVLDNGYPENLRVAHDRPPLIFVAGRLHPGDARSIAVIGTRHPSSAGEQRAAAIAEHLAAGGYTVTSGLATGIDTAAHSATLEAGGRTNAVIGTGHDHAYPSPNGPLQTRIAQSGAVISQFWPDTPPARRNFPMRNAVMSGLSLATVVVEAHHRSGARIQARIALAHGRPVLLADALVREQPWAAEFAGRPGTHVFTNPAQITSIVERLTSPGTLVG
jgi:DNA processing protein